VQGFDTPFPGQLTCPPGVILLGRDGDSVTTRPEWAKDGSFLCFRLLAQRVPEFDAFLTANALAINDPSAPADLGKELLGARMVGRWKSGTPIELAALQDDPTIGADPQQNNNFNFSKDPDQSRCPFAGHIRKTNPRADLDSVTNGLTPHRIIRRGIAFGPEVTQEESDSGTTSQSRGLLFVCYQSALANGFQFIQKSKRSYKVLI
jgi:Dyp-type peroxidase family